MAFQRKPVRGRARVTELFPLALQLSSSPRLARQTFVRGRAVGGHNAGALQVC